jgi:hypothetical protein
MSKPIIYLAGNMTPTPVHYKEWTLRMGVSLASRYRTTESKFKDGEKFIIRQDLGRLKNSHMVVVNLGVSDVSHHLTGLVVECYEAYKQHMPVYAFVSKEMQRSQQANSPWLKYSITQEFENELELIKYLMDKENLIV